jgi:hypothetical protein
VSGIMLIPITNYYRGPSLKGAQSLHLGLVRTNPSEFTVYEVSKTDK